MVHCWVGNLERLCALWDTRSSFTCALYSKLVTVSRHSWPMLVGTCPFTDSFLPEMHKMLLIYYSIFPIGLSSGRHSRGKKQGDVNIQGEEFDSHRTKHRNGQSQALPWPIHTVQKKSGAHLFTTKYKRATAKDEPTQKVVNPMPSKARRLRHHHHRHHRTNHIPSFSQTKPLESQESPRRIKPKNTNLDRVSGQEGKKT